MTKVFICSYHLADSQGAIQTETLLSENNLTVSYSLLAILEESPFLVLCRFYYQIFTFCFIQPLQMLFLDAFDLDYCKVLNDTSKSII